MKKLFLTLFLSITFFIGCGINSVTKEELENVKPGDVLIYRYYRKEDARSWFFAEKITRVEGENIYYNPGVTEATSGRETRLAEFDTETEKSTAKSSLVKYAEEQGDVEMVIIRIQKSGEN